MTEENNNNFEWFYTDNYRDVPKEKGICALCRCIIYESDNFIEVKAGLFCSKSCYIEAIDQGITDEDQQLEQNVHDHPVLSDNVPIGNVSDLFSSDEEFLKKHFVLCTVPGFKKEV